MKYENETIYEKYEKSVLTEKKIISEAKTGFRRKVQLLDDRIDDFLDEVEKKIKFNLDISINS